MSINKMSYSSEYSKPMVGSAGCAYQTAGCSGRSNPTMPPMKAGTTSGVYLTPDYQGIGYNALTHGVPGGCQQYFNIQDAYGSGAGNCSTSYTSRLCGGCGGGGGRVGGAAYVCDSPRLGGKKACRRVQAGTKQNSKVYHSGNACEYACRSGTGHSGSGY